MTKNKSEIVKMQPFLRWAGGKRWLVSRLRSKLDISQFTSYHEPFIGGGAMLFSFLPENAFISDVNEQLMQAYLIMKENPEAIIEFIQALRTDEETYYRVRSMAPQNEIEAAGRFIYLNRTSFNGIYRVNLRGEYNVPWGKKLNYQFDYENLRKVGKYLQKVEISHGDFELCLEHVRENSLVFLDPPYIMSKNNNVFLKYNQRAFSEQDQERLADMIEEIKRRGAFYILTNSNHEKVIETFDKGDNRIELTRTSLIGGTNAKRGAYEECIFTNLDLTI